MSAQHSIRWLATLAATAVAAVTVMASTKASAAAPWTATPASEIASGPGLPADFPIAPGLSPCKPTVVSGEVICDWQGADGHAVYQFYLTALPKAGYKLLPGAGEVTTPREFGAIGFTKGDVQGAVSIHGGDVTVQVLYGNGK